MLYSLLCYISDVCLLSRVSTGHCPGQCYTIKYVTAVIVTAGSSIYGRDIKFSTCKSVMFTAESIVQVSAVIFVCYSSDFYC